MDRTSKDEGLEHRRLEEALKVSEERFARLVEAAKDYAIFMVDTEGCVTAWNEGAERIFGYEEGEILGEDGTILFTPEDRRSGRHEREMETARTEGRAEDERWHMRKDGSRFWASGFVRPVRDEGGSLLGFSKVARDLTEFKRAEEAIEEVRREERERIARDLHDLVLQDLVMALQLGEAHRLTRRGDAREAAEDVKEMLDSLRRASRGVREAVHELRAGEVVGRALGRAVEDLVVLERRRSPGVEVEFSVAEGIPAELPKEVCRDVLLVIREALANARRHAGARHVLVALNASDEEIKVEVTDDGAGFDPREGAEGVGLNAMRERSASLGGSLDVSSEPRRGTTVRLRFPRPS